MDAYVTTMHTKSGLLPEIAASTTDLATAGARTLEYIQQFIPTTGTTPLCGNSIGTDRRFLAAHLRDIDDWLHYRSIDVSSFKELCRRWYPTEYKARPNKAETHRALDDIRESVAEMKYYREAMLKPR
jgi:oligoribonuclease